MNRPDSPIPPGARCPVAAQKTVVLIPPIVVGTLAAARTFTGDDLGIVCHIIYMH